MVKNTPHIIFINKSDLPKKINLTDENIVIGNTIELNGLENLKNKIIEMYNLDKIEEKDSTYLSNIRQINLVNNALNEITTAINEADNLIPVDMLEINLRNAWKNLGILIGETYEDELIDKLFKNFCLGK
jgi:tRNA modification GTPase